MFNEQYLAIFTGAWNLKHQGGGGGGGASAECDKAVKDSGLPGLTYANALEIWHDAASIKGADITLVAELGVITWAGESGFSRNPKNNGNSNGSVDLGPFQLNYPLQKSSVPASQWDSVFGTNLAAGQSFNGDTDANVVIGLKYLAYLSGKFEDQAAGLYTGRNNPNRSKRQATFDTYKDALGILFKNAACFKTGGK